MGIIDVANGAKDRPEGCTCTYFMDAGSMEVKRTPDPTCRPHAIEQRAYELQAQGPDEFPFGYYRYLAEQELAEKSDQGVDLDLDTMDEPVEDQRQVVVLSVEQFQAMIAPQPLPAPYVLWRTPAWSTPDEAMHACALAYQWWATTFWPRLPRGSARIRIGKDMHDALTAYVKEQDSARQDSMRYEPIDTPGQGYDSLYGLPVDTDERVPRDEIHFTIEN